MPSTAIDSQIHGFLFSTDEMREIFSDRSWAQKWLDTEAALAAAQAELGIIPQEKADIIVKHADADLLDIPSIGEFYKSSITIVPLLKAFKAVLPDNAGEFVHWGATSQDIVDTGLVLLQRDAYKVILRDMELCREYCLDLAEKYRNTVMAGRTHVVHAIPITFGYKAAVWADELGRNVERLKAMAPRHGFGPRRRHVRAVRLRRHRGGRARHHGRDLLCDLLQLHVGHHGIRRRPGSDLLRSGLFRASALL